MKQDIKEYYKESVKKNTQESFEDFLKQVGKTFLGDTINDEQFKRIIDSIQKNLDIQKNDQLLDLGCANGLISSKVITKCLKLIGYDMSEDLITTAKKYHQRENVSYYCKNIMEVDFKVLSIEKIYMYEVLQHLEYSNLNVLLNKLKGSVDSFSFFIGSIPDQEKIFDFYNTKERKKYYFEKVLSNNKFHIGNWWYKEQIQYLCEDLRLECNIIEQDKSLHTAHYRFDCLIEKKK